MSTTTDHLHLVKPAKNETADSDVINANMVAIDTAIHALGHKPTTDAGKFMMVDNNGEVKPTAVPTQGATTYNVSGSDRTIPAKTYLSGAQTIKAVTTQNIDAGNIKSGVVVKVGDANNAGRIKNVTGTHVGQIEYNYQTYDDTISINDSGFGQKACSFSVPSGYNKAYCAITQAYTAGDCDIDTIRIDNDNATVEIAIHGPTHQAYTLKAVTFGIVFFRVKP